MMIHELLCDLYSVIEESPLSLPISVIDGNKMYFGKAPDEHMRKLTGREIKRWALYNDHSELMIELEVER